MEQEYSLDELHEHYSFTADSGQEPLRVDKFLMNDFYKTVFIWLERCEEIF